MRNFCYTAFCLMVAHVTLSASAATDAHHNEINWWGLGSAYKDAPALGWLTISFIIFVFIFVKAIKKPLALYFQTRSKDIRHQIEESKFIKEQNELKLKECQEKLLTLEKDIHTLKESFKEQAKKEEHEIMKKSLDMSQRIKKDIQSMIDANFERSKNRLSEEVIVRAIDKAQNYFKSNAGEVDANLKEVFAQEIKTQIGEISK